MLQTTYTDARRAKKGKDAEWLTSQPIWIQSYARCVNSQIYPMVGMAEQHPSLFFGAGKLVEGDINRKSWPCAQPGHSQKRLYNMQIYGYMFILYALYVMQCVMCNVQCVICNLCNMCNM